jgi:hypothetical protein
MTTDPIQYSTSDGKRDLIEWISMEIEEDLNRRDPVIIEADVLKFNWVELEMTQFLKYGTSF